jgi:hypothetical protein
MMLDTQLLTRLPRSLQPRLTTGFDAFIHGQSQQLGFRVVFDYLMQYVKDTQTVFTPTQGDENPVVASEETVFTYRALNTFLKQLDETLPAQRPGAITQVNYGLPPASTRIHSNP